MTVLSRFMIVMVLFASAACMAATQPSSPNILIVYVDDWRFDALGANEGSLTKTPVLDEIAARGTRFRNGFVTMSICSPSRAALQTGRYNSANGVTTNDTPLGDGEITFAQLFSEAGYRTGAVGKWHLAQTPEELGFDYSFYFNGNGLFYNRVFSEGGKKTFTEGYVEHNTAEAGERFIRDATDAEQPFVLFYNTQVPHMAEPMYDWPVRDTARGLYDLMDMEIPKNYRDDFSGKPSYLISNRQRTRAQFYGYDHEMIVREHKLVYNAAVTEMDESLGRVVAALQAEGIADNTYIVVMGDNGWLLGEHGLTSKVLPYEQSIRVPFFVAGPGIPSKVSDELALNIDVMPTILQWAGLKTPDRVHGKSLVPLLQASEDRPNGWRDRFLYEVPNATFAGNPPLFAVRTEQFKLVQTFDLDGQRVEYEELYDIDSDPGEMNNLVDNPQHQSLLKQLRKDIVALRAAVAN